MHRTIFNVVLEDLHNTNEHMWQNSAREGAALIDNLGQAQRSPGLNILVLLAERLEQRPHQATSATPPSPNSLAHAESVPQVSTPAGPRAREDRVGVLEAQDGAGHHLGHVRRQQAPVRPRQCLEADPRERRRRGRPAGHAGDGDDDRAPNPSYGWGRAVELEAGTIESKRRRR